jgi:hypothetical protein
LPTPRPFAIRFSVKICKAAFAKKIGPILVAAATAFNKYYKIVWPMRSLAYSVGREPFAIRFGVKIRKA